MPRVMRLSVWILASVAAFLVLLVVVIMAAGNTAAGRAMLVRATDRLTGGSVELDGLGGSFPADLTLQKLRLIDRSGVWLSADHISLRWSPLALLERRIAVDNLRVARLDMERVPRSDPSTGGPVSVPHIDIAQFSIDVLQLGAQLAGSPATLSARGGGHMRSLEDASAEVVAHRIDSDGEYTLHFRFDRARMDGTLAVHEPASGPLENILHLPGLGALSANLSVSGARRAEQIELKLSAGELSATLAGSMDFTDASADLEYSLQAPQVAPRPDLRWQRIALKGRWRGTLTDPTADGQLQIDQLRLPDGTEMAALRADLSAVAGNLTIRGVIDGLRIPGPAAALLAKDPLRIDASMRLNEAARPLELVATHRLLSLRAQASTAGRQSMTLELRLPDIAPLAALAGQSVRGDATLKAQIDRRRSDWGFSLDADAAIAGAAGTWIGALGNRVALKLAGSLSDETIAVQRMQLAGREWTLSASASATRPPSGSSPALSHAAADDYIRELRARWDLNIPDLGMVSSALAGALQASGDLRGPPTKLLGDATFRSTLSIRGSPPGTLTGELHARNLPSAPSVTIKVGGTIDGSPLELAASLEGAGDGGLRASIQRAAWKSAHLEGDLVIASSIADSHGQIRLRLDQLGDLDRLLGTNLGGGLDGSVTIARVSGRTHAQFQLDGRDLVSRPFSGTLHLTGEGTTESVSVHLNLQTPDFQGASASLSANADVDLDHHELRVLSAAAAYRGQQLRLLSPGRLSYENGFKIEQLKLGVQDAVLQIEGELSPSLDLHASLTQVNPKLINVFVSDALAEGTIEGQARLQGSWSAPTGRITITGRGMRSGSDQAVGFPAVDLDATANLRDGGASIELRLTAGSASLLTITGTAPLNSEGAFDLKVSGALDIAIANPLFEARGMHVDGRLAVDATLGGNPGAPQIRGTITLAQGDLRDYARGLNLTHINAQISGSEAALQIKSFTASAAAGTVAISGNIGLLESGIPVDLKIIATNAQAITSNIVSANVDADIRVSGTARERIALAGSIHVNRAVIGIPDSLPPGVAVLDVRRRGKATTVAAKQLQIDLDVAIQAPRQILVRGRGLDAELGSDRDLHVSGTVDAPLVSGDFDLQRGSFTIGSTKLTFTAGRVGFNGTGLRKNIDPSLDFTTAQATAANITAFLRITGYADAPKFEFISVPPGAPEDEIMSVLLFGEPAAQLTALQAVQIAAALATLTGVGGSGANPLTKIQKSLGLDSLSVGAGTTTTATGATQNSGAAIAAGRYISKRIYVEGTQTTTGQSQVQVDVDLTKHLKVQTRLGNGTAIQGTTPENDPGSSIGLSYQFEY
jgi:translocation and assembly module TamB